MVSINKQYAKSRQASCCWYVVVERQTMGLYVLSVDFNSLYDTLHLVAPSEEFTSLEGLWRYSQSFSIVKIVKMANLQL